MRALATIAAALMSFLLLSGCNEEGSERGQSAYDEDDYATAMSEWQPLAEGGDADAQSNVGFMYANGQGVPQNYIEAVRWYRLAAQQGFADAQNNLGSMYENGRGVLQNYTEAVRSYRQAAEQGLAIAQYNLGSMYAIGHGVPEDYERAYMWANLSSAQGNIIAAEFRDSLLMLMTAEQLARAQQMSQECLERNYQGC